MQRHGFRLLAVILVLVGFVVALTLLQPALAAPQHLPSVGPVLQGQIEAVSIDLSSSDEVVPLGQVFTYTAKVANTGSESVAAQVTSELPALPDGLALQRASISATVGSIEAVENSIVWTGELGAGDEAVVTYAAIAPSTAAADQSFATTAVLEVGGAQKEAQVRITTVARELGLWGRFVNFIAQALVLFDVTFERIGLPYAFGFAIIIFTIVVRLATFPLNMQQIKSAKGMQELQPKLKALQDKYKNDRESLAREQMALYKEHGVNPLGGCLPLIVQMPIWFALYQALVQLSHEGLLNQGFFWIPSLSGPVSNFGGSGILPEWLTSMEYGIAGTIAYLVMPVLLIVSQVYTQKIMTPPATDPQQAQMQNIMKFMPIMFGYFALNVPSGLTLYWFTSNILGVAQHYLTKTQYDKKPEAAGASVGSAPVPASTPSSGSVPATSAEGDTNTKDDRKRKSRRKR